MNETEVINAINLLVREGYLLNPANEDLMVTSKMTRFYREMKNRQRPSPTSVVFQKETITLREFRDQAEVPHQIKTKTFTFNTGRISLAAEKYFNKEVVGKVNMERLITATKAYYKNANIARVTLTNYFLEGVWEGVYKENLKQPEVAKPTFNGERSL